MLNLIKTPLSFFIGNIGNALEDDIVEAEWQPAIGEIVLFLDEKNVWRTGAYAGNWQDIRKANWSDERKANDTSIEDSPYYGDTTIRAKVNHAERNERGEWVIETMFSFPAIADINKFEAANIEYALLSNQAHRNSLELGRAS